jgi:PAS domain S-box-containing protein
MFELLSASLKRISIVLAMTVLGAILFVDLYIHSSFKAQAIKSWDSERISHLEHISRLIDQQLEDALLDLEFIAKHPTMQSLPDIGSIDLSLNGLPENVDSKKRQLLDTFLLNNKRFSVLFVLTSEGDHYISHPFPVQISLKKFNLSDRPYIQEARRSKRPVISDRFLGADGVPAVAMAVPLLNWERDIYGYLGGVFHIKDISNLLLAKQTNSGQVYFLVDRHGQLVADFGSKDLLSIQENSAKHPLVKKFLNLEEHAQQKPEFINYFCNIHAEECRGAFISLESGWGLFVEKSQQSFEKEVHRQARQPITIVAAILLILGTVAFVFVRRISIRLSDTQKQLQVVHSSLESKVEERTFELEEQKQHIQLLLESVAEAIYGLDLEGTCTFCNKSCVELLGYRSEDDLLGCNMHHKIHHTHKDGSIHPIQECQIFQSFITGENIYCPDDILWRADGTSFDAEVWSHPIKKNGEVVGSVVTFLDVSEKKSLQLKAIRSSQLATLGEISAGVAHEINNPVNGIINYAQLILNKATNDSREQDLSQRIIKEGTRIAAIVRNLLSFARNSNEKIEAHDLASLTEHPLSLVKSSLDKDGISVHVSIDSDVPELECNAQQIEQTILNLVNNAHYSLNKKYPHPATEKEIHIIVSTKIKDNKPHVSIQVKDCGIGIPEDIVPNIFNAFFTTKEAGRGTGLGLSICEDIIRAHNGNIHVDTQEGEYTIFTLELPCKR